MKKPRTRKKAGLSAKCDWAVREFLSLCASVRLNNLILVFVERKSDGSQVPVICRVEDGGNGETSVWPVAELPRNPSTLYKAPLGEVEAMDTRGLTLCLGRKVKEG